VTDPRQRTVVNLGNQQLDASGIEVGRTDRGEVIRALGLPPPDVPEEIGIRVAGRDFLRYSTWESRCFRIGFEQILLITPFRWCSRRDVYELSVEFDEDGIVSGLYETRRGNYWPPFQDEDASAPTVVRGLGGSPQP
jgi:hypothetical protein